MENFHFGQKVNIYGHGSQIFHISEVYEDSVRLRQEGGPTLLGFVPFNEITLILDDDVDPLEHYETLKVIKALNLFFYNYSTADITNLRNQSKRFDLIWTERFEESQTTFQEFWDCWASGLFDYPIQKLIIEAALAKYGKEAGKKAIQNF